MFNLLRNRNNCVFKDVKRIPCNGLQILTPRSFRVQELELEVDLEMEPRPLHAAPIGVSFIWWLQWCMGASTSSTTNPAIHSAIRTTRTTRRSGSDMWVQTHPSSGARAFGLNGSTLRSARTWKKFHYTLIKSPLQINILLKNIKS